MEDISVWSVKFDSGNVLTVTLKPDGKVWVSHPRNTFWLYPEQWSELCNKIKIDPLPCSTIPTLGELVGYRVWRVHRGYLRSLYHDTIWDYVEPIEATVDNFGKKGIYAYKSKCDALTEFMSQKHKSYLLVLGTVDLWGDIIVHESGYRAQFAQIRTLDQIRWTSFTLNQWRNFPIVCFRFWRGLKRHQGREWLDELQVKYLGEKGECNEDVCAG